MLPPIGVSGVSLLPAATKSLDLYEYDDAGGDPSTWVGMDLSRDEDDDVGGKTGNSNSRGSPGAKQHAAADSNVVVAANVGGGAAACDRRGN
jgi:hypothetical protein